MPDHKYFTLSTKNMKLKLAEFEQNINSQPTFKAVKCNLDEQPIECMLNKEGEIIVIDGHHILGLAISD